MDESYHSIHGAIQESMHVFINQGFHAIRKPKMRILETGLGTGLNLLLTLIESEKHGTEIYYHAVEKYPLTPSEFEKLNYEQSIPGAPSGYLKRVHLAPWGEEYSLDDGFRILKEKADFRTMDPPAGFDLVYFDAFAPDKQPQLWTSEIFSKLYNVMNPGALLVSYSSKGSVRRALTSCGFEVKKIPGPPGKREMIQAFRS